MVLAVKLDVNQQSIEQQIQLYENKLVSNPSDFKTTEALVELYLYQTNYDKAERLINRFLKRKNCTPYLQANCWLWKAEIRKFNNKIDEAFFYYMYSKDAFIRLKRWKDVVFCNARLMEFYRKNNKHKTGIVLAKTTEKLIAQHGVKDLKALNLFYNRYAALLNEQAKGILSLKLSKKALIYADLLKDQNAQAISYNEMGFSYKNANKVDLAIEHYKKAENHWRLKGYIREAINAEYNIIMMYAHNNLIDLDEQIDSFKAIKKKANSYKIYDYDVPLLHFISTSYMFKGDTKNELKYYRLAVARTNELEEIDRNLKLRDVEEKYKNSQLKEKLKTDKQQIADQLKQNIRNQRTIWVFFILTIFILAGLIYSFTLQQKFKKSLTIIQQKDEQKNMLIAEIHHRVKNNLQYVRSMLEMQLSIVSEEKDKQNLEDVSRRIQAMSLVHEMLYNKEETTGINLSEYLNQLFQYLLIGFSSSNQPKLQITIPPIEVSISEATSLGIICAELFNNSVKYAFINHPNPLFDLDVELKNDTIILLVKDNGENFSVPSNSQDKNRQKLGLRIIDIFARQLKATYQIDKEKGYRFELRYTRSKVE